MQWCMPNYSKHGAVFFKHQPLGASSLCQVQNTNNENTLDGELSTSFEYIFSINFDGEKMLFASKGAKTANSISINNHLGFNVDSKDNIDSLHVCFRAACLWDWHLQRKLTGSFKLHGVHNNPLVFFEGRWALMQNRTTAKTSFIFVYIILYIFKNPRAYIYWVQNNFKSQ